MFKDYESEWHGIKFTEFTTLSKSRLPTEGFYSEYYCKFFEKYNSYNDLSDSWRQSKDKIVEWLCSAIPVSSRILSIGCGIGYIEQKIWIESNYVRDICVSDYSSQALKWIRNIFPEDKILDSEARVKTSGQFDVVIMCSVDYSLDDLHFRKLSSSLCQHLKPDGKIILISAFHSAGGFILRFKRALRVFIKPLFYMVFPWHDVQFWGYRRTRGDYRRLLFENDLRVLQDGYIKDGAISYYWISGCKGL